MSNRRNGDSAAMGEKKVACLGPHGFHQMAYTQWGDADNPNVVLCVHGLARTGRDFDTLAAALAPDYRVICPDVAGRGRSDWLVHPNDYGYPLYLNDMATLIARLGVDQLDWVGTSMGGLIGMMMAAQPGTPVRKLIMNDVGPFIPKAAIERILGYFGKPITFADLDAAELYFREIYASFGNLADAQWRHLAQTGVRRDKAGEYTLHYDPDIAKPMNAAEPADVDLWPVWDMVKCPVLSLRGAQSDLLQPQTASRMLDRAALTELVEIPDVGHAPALMDDKQIAYVCDWLGR